MVRKQLTLALLALFISAPTQETACG